jgi:hypothetical protein
MIPGSATVWGQLVQCSVLDQMQRLQVAPAGHSVGHTNTGAHAAPGIPPPGSFKQASHTLQAVMRMIADLDAAARISSSSSAQVPANSTTTDQGLQWQRLHGLHVDPLCESGLLQPLSPPVRYEEQCRMIIDEYGEMSVCTPQCLSHSHSLLVAQCMRLHLNTCPCIKYPPCPP